MELKEVWLAYVNDRISAANAVLAPVEFTAEASMRRFFDLHPMFSARWAAINATPFNSDFDESADMALVQLAAKDSFDDWDRLPAGIWRVIGDRLMYSQIVLAVMMFKEPDRIIDRLPQGLTQQEQSKALLLKYLLGHGRSIDRHILPITHDLSLGSFPGAQTLRKQ